MGKKVETEEEEWRGRLERGEMWAPPYDPRFPNQNQTRRCWVNFVDYQKCIRARGEDFEPCKFYKRVYQAICPNAWSEKWINQIESGTFPYNFHDGKNPAFDRKEHH